MSFHRYSNSLTIRKEEKNSVQTEMAIANRLKVISNDVRMWRYGNSYPLWEV